MPTYVLMTKLDSKTLSDPRGRREVGRKFMKSVERACKGVKWVAHYALLGPYDFMDIYEAPDDATAIRISLLSRAEGALTAESWPAVGYEGFLAIADDVEKVLKTS